MDSTNRGIYFVATISVSYGRKILMKGIMEEESIIQKCKSKQCRMVPNLRSPITSPRNIKEIHFLLAELAPKSQLCWQPAIYRIKMSIPFYAYTHAYILFLPHNHNLHLVLEVTDSIMGQERFLQLFEESHTSNRW